jgi:hypothetical protein
MSGWKLAGSAGGWSSSRRQATFGLASALAFLAGATISLVTRNG